MHSNVWLVTGAINTPWGLIDPAQRYHQTLKTLHSIKHKDAHAYVVLLDSSMNAMCATQLHELKSLCDQIISVGNRKICRIMNQACMKGAGECHMLLLGLQWITEQNILPHRIFKITGRYSLTNDFDVKVHEQLHRKYVFKTRGTHEWGSTFLHTRMWSVCGGLSEHATQLLQKSCLHHVTHNCTIEESLFHHMDLTLLTEFDKIHCEGWIAPWNKLIQD
jgi:hypothetical protein